MTTNLLRNSLMMLGLLALLCIGLLTYNQTRAAVPAETATDCANNNPNAEMPWETLSRHLVGMVSL